MDPGRRFGDRAGKRWLVGTGNQPTRRAGVSKEGQQLGEDDRELAEAECPVERRIGQSRARCGGGIALLEDPHVVARLGRRPPHRQPRVPLDALEQIQLVVDPRARLRRGRQDPDCVIRPDVSGDEDARTSVNRPGG